VLEKIAAKGFTLGSASALFLSGIRSFVLKLGDELDIIRVGLSSLVSP